MRSTRYVRVKIEIEHPENVSPEKVLDEMDYEFTSTMENTKIVDTHIEEYEEKYE